MNWLSFARALREHANTAAVRWSPPSGEPLSVLWGMYSNLQCANKRDAWRSMFKQSRRHFLILLCIVFHWLRTGTGGGLLWMRWWISGFRKMRGISWLAANLLATQEGICSAHYLVIVFTKIRVFRWILYWNRSIQYGTDQLWTYFSAGFVSRFSKSSCWCYIISQQLYFRVWPNSLLCKNCVPSTYSK